MWSVECSFRWLQPSPLTLAATPGTPKRPRRCEAAVVRGGLGRPVTARRTRPCRASSRSGTRTCRPTGRRRPGRRRRGSCPNRTPHTSRPCRPCRRGSRIPTLVGLLQAVLPLGWRRRRRGRSAVGRTAGDAAAFRRAAVGGAAVGGDTGASMSSDGSVVRRPSRRVCHRRQGRRPDRRGRPTNLNCRLLLTTVARTRNPSWSSRVLPM